jgi:3-oxoadipate enol-lactonase
MHVSVNGTRLFLSDTGLKSGRPVVFVHGFPFSHEMWAPQIEALNNDYRCIAYDIRGLGRSDVGDGQYMIEIFVDDLIALLDHLQIDKAAVCGLSMGGYVALRAVEKNPERFNALILADTRSEADSNEAKLKRAGALKGVKTDLKAFAEGFVKAVFAPETFKTHPQSIQKIRTIIESATPQGICGSILALASRTDTTASLAKISIPTLVLVGEHDTLTPPSVALAMAKQIPGAEYKEISKSGHMSNMENPGEFNSHLLTFLKQNCG